MKKITAAQIQTAVDTLVLSANTRLRPDVLRAVRAAHDAERNPDARRRLQAIIENARIARRQRLAICQDTGLPVVFAELGGGVQIIGGVLPRIIERAVAGAYRRHYLRASIQADPLTRSQKNSTGPCLVHLDIVAGPGLRLTLLPKGFGCENKSQVKMFNPTADPEQVEDFIVNAVRQAGGSACPPFVVGVGIGGTQDYACLLAKQMLLRPLGRRSRNSSAAAMEQRLLSRMNRLDVGPFGFGGDTTALAVAVGVHPTHIAGLPVAVNISCHALRSASVLL